MLGTVTYRVGGLTLVVILALTLCSVQPARAGGDLPKILAGAAVGYLVYKALDDECGSVYQYGCYDRCSRGHPPNRYRSPRRHQSAYKAYRSGYRDGWHDGFSYGRRSVGRVCPRTPLRRSYLISY